MSSFTLPEFGDPEDPKYLSFFQGLESITANEYQNLAQRWDHGLGQWVPFPPSQWVLEDIGLSNTSPGDALKSLWTFPNSPTPNWDLQRFYVPDLFRRVAAAYAADKTWHPNQRIVWGPWQDGSWRSVLVRTSGSGTTKTYEGLNQECVKQIYKVRDAERQGFITHDKAQELIDKIVASCT